MSLEPILAFFIVRYLRKSMIARDEDSEWIRILTITMYGVVLLAVSEFIFHITPFVMWVWYVFLFGLMYLIYKNPVFDFAKQLTYARLPVILLILLDFVSDLLKAINPGYYGEIKNYINLAFCVAITWMITTIVKSNKQQKALEAERKKTQAEEERSKFIAAKKDELELMVNERTSELLKQKDDLQQALTELRETQALLIQSEKMASLGELTAGIAHEIQNPLNFVNNFAEVNTELIEELKAESQKPKAERNEELEVEILNDIKQNLEKINHHGKRADAIVKGMLEHSRTSTGQKEPTDINALADEYLRLSYHGLRAKDKSFNANIQTDFDITIGKIDVVAPDMGRVLLNLFNNAFYAVTERLRQAPREIGTGNPGARYEPSVSVSTKKIGQHVEIKVRDNGNGIPQNVIDKIFQPFFTTKPTGEGTGLGLSLSYDIVKAHGGEIRVDSLYTEGTAKGMKGNGTEFIITLPLD